MNRRPDVIMEEMLATFRERNKLYGDNYLKMGKVLQTMFPDGVFLKTEKDFAKWHLFEWMIGKITRLAATNLTHEDSALDTAVYAAMLRSVMESDLGQEPASHPVPERVEVEASEKAVPEPAPGISDWVGSPFVHR